MVNNMALFQLFGDVFYGNAKFNHQNHHMVGKVADLVNGFLFVALAAMITSVDSSPTFFRIFSSPLSNR